MRLVLGSLFALVVAAVIGLGATWLALSKGVAFGAVRIGAWTAWPKNGTREIDPYARASIARTGELPIGSGDGVAFVARVDDHGHVLDGRCDVAVSGTTPPARFWTLTLYDPDGRLVATADITFVAVRGAARKLASWVAPLNPPEVLHRIFPAYA